MLLQSRIFCNAGVKQAPGEQPVRQREYRRYPFTIILKARAGGDTQPVTLKVDPGSKTTGIALVGAFERGKQLLWAAELTHRGEQVKAGLLKRRQVRRSRRHRHTRYRPARFANRKRKEGWLAPSMRSRIENVKHWTLRLAGFCPISSFSLELTKFDTQKMQHPEITGIEYQQGELQGYEVREYLLEKWGRTCAYCQRQNVPLEVEHLIPTSRGGSHRVSNLAIACHDCNQKKGAQTAAEFGHPNVQKQAKVPLKDAAAVNITRWALHNFLAGLGCPLETGTGARTKYNRTRQNYPKTHWLDAACVGESGELIFVQPGHTPLLIAATGRGSRQMCRVDKYGFPRGNAKKQKRVRGFQTGDMVKAVVTEGKHKGVYVGRVAVRATGSFNIQTAHGVIQGIAWRFCQLLQRNDGYHYQKGEPLRFPPHA